jgi:tight adherence protein B
VIDELLGVRAVSSVWKWLGAACSVLTVALLGWQLMTRPESLPRRIWQRYLEVLERNLRQQFLSANPMSIATGQGALFALSLSAWLLTGFHYGWALVAASVVGPILYIEKLRRERLAKLHAQVEPFLLAFTNSLRTTPSIGLALANIEPLLPNPMRQEIGLVLKELRLGTTLEQSLLNMGGRTRIVELEAALSSIMIGRQVGGNLPEILGTHAATLREMSRLSGVVKTKTASGRIQLFVLALAPGGVIVAFETASPGYFNPLLQTFIGGVVMVVALVLWLAAIGIARQVLAVDI